MRLDINTFKKSSGDTLLVEHPEASNDRCPICQEMLATKRCITFSSCPHSYHYLCFLGHNFSKSLKCYECKRKCKGMLLSAEYALTNVAITITKSYYTICQWYVANDKVQGFAILFGLRYRQADRNMFNIRKTGTYKLCFLSCNDPMNDVVITGNTHGKSKIFKFQISGTSHSCYLSYTDPQNPVIVSKAQQRALPYSVRRHKHHISYDLQMKDEEILGLEVKALPAENMKIAIVKVLLVDGMTSEEMDDTMDIEEFGHTLPFRKFAWHH